MMLISYSYSTNSSRNITIKSSLYSITPKQDNHMINYNPILSFISSDMIIGCDGCNECMLMTW